LNFGRMITLAALRMDSPPVCPDKKSTYTRVRKSEPTSYHHTPWPRRFMESLRMLEPGELRSTRRAKNVLNVTPHYPDPRADCGSTIWLPVLSRHALCRSFLRVTRKNLHMDFEHEVTRLRGHVAGIQQTSELGSPLSTIRVGGGGGVLSPSAFVGNAPAICCLTLLSVDVASTIVSRSNGDTLLFHDEPRGNGRRDSISCESTGSCREKRRHL